MSRLPFELLLALRYLRPKRTFVSIITLISVLGVTLGVAVLIIVISVMSGFDKELRDKVLGFNAHIKILKIDPTTGREVVMEDYRSLMKAVASNQNVTAVAPYALGQVLVETEPMVGEPLFRAPYLRGVDPQAEMTLSQIGSNLVKGFDLDGRGLLVGTDLAQALDLSVGDSVVVFSPTDLKQMMKSRKEGKEEVVLPKDFEVRGIFDSGFYEYNATVVVASLENLQRLYGLGDSVQGLMVMVKDPDKASEVGAQIVERLGSHFRARPWNEENNPTMAAVMVEKDVMLYTLFFIVIVAAFGITCTLITFVVLKTREIGVLKALGASSRQVMWIFLSQSMVVSIFGIAIGLGLGLLALTFRNGFLHFMRNVTNLDLFPAKIYGFYELPALIVPKDIIIICGGSMIICLLASAFPVWNAARLRPVEALRHE